MRPTSLFTSILAAGALASCTAAEAPTPEPAPAPTSEAPKDPKSEPVPLLGFCDCVDNCETYCCEVLGDGTITDCQSQYADACCVGRPLMVDGKPRTAQVELNDDWADA